MPINIHDALSQVRELRQRVLEHQLFHGYSGGARALGGVTALLCALTMASGIYPQTVRSHVIGWGVVCATAVALNYGALVRWHRRLGPEERQMVTLRPALDVLPALFVGGILTLTLLLHGSLTLLFGIWMCIYGLAHLSARYSLPRTIRHLGWYYIACGFIFLLIWPVDSFTNPWPMGIVFFFGEITGSFILAKQRSDRFSVKNFLRRKEGS